MERSDEWNAGYEAGYRDGESSLFADYDVALDGLIDDPWPTTVQARIEGLESLLRRYIEHVAIDALGPHRVRWHLEFNDDERAELERLSQSAQT